MPEVILRRRLHAPIAEGAEGVDRLGLDDARFVERPSRDQCQAEVLLLLRGDVAEPHALGALHDLFHGARRLLERARFQRGVADEPAIVAGRTEVAGALGALGRLALQFEEAADVAVEVGAQRA